MALVLEVHCQPLLIKFRPEKLKSNKESAIYALYLILLDFTFGDFGTFPVGFSGADSNRNSTNKSSRLRIIRSKDVKVKV